MPRPKTVFQSVSRVVDTSTGEVISEQYRKIKKSVHKRKFIFLSIVENKIYQLSGSELKVLIFLTENKMLDIDEIVVVKSLKEKASEVIGISVGRIDNIVSSLVKKGALERKDYSTYKLNPDYSWRGKFPAGVEITAEEGEQ